MSSSGHYVPPPLKERQSTAPGGYNYEEEGGRDDKQTEHAYDRQSGWYDKQVSNTSQGEASGKGNGMSSDSAYVAAPMSYAAAAVVSYSSVATPVALAPGSSAVHYPTPLQAPVAVAQGVSPALDSTPHQAPVALAQGIPPALDSPPHQEVCDEHSPGKKYEQKGKVVLPPKRDEDRIDERLVVGRQAASLGEKHEGDLLAFCEKEFADCSENYLRGCKWSPDGRLLMTNSNDNAIRIFNIPDGIFENQWDVHTELTSQQKVPETDLIYDFAWYPGTKYDSPESCMFATTVRQIPIHVWSAVTGELVCTFRPYNNVDEIVAAHSIGFNSNGRYLAAGFNRKIRIFDTNRPGRDCVVSSTVLKEQEGNLMYVRGQRGILSCFAAHPTDPKIMAAGAFNGDVAVYNIPEGSSTAVFEGQPGGITHITFSQDGRYLFAGGRKDPEINCFDMRNPEKVLYVIYRHVATNQRLYFDVDRSSHYLLSGHHNGNVSTWDLKGRTQPNPLLPWPRLDPISHFSAHQDTVSGLQINPRHSIMATCCGQRHFPESIFRDPEDSPPEFTPDSTIEENSLKIWNLKLP